jgi:Cytochrome P450
MALRTTAGSSSSAPRWPRCGRTTRSCPACVRLTPSGGSGLSSVQFFPNRSALADIEIAGTTIPKGAPIFLMYGPANRDPRRFPELNTFDPQRNDNEHVGGGAASMSVSAVRWPGCRSTPHSRRSCGGWKTRGSWRTRRRTGSARCSAGRGTCSLISTRSDPEKRCSESVSIRRLSPTGELLSAPMRIDYVSDTGVMMTKRRRTREHDRTDRINAERALNNADIAEPSQSPPFCGVPLPHAVSV